MQKRNLKKLAVLGLASGLLAASHLNAAEATKPDNKTTDTKGPSSANPDDGNLDYHLMTEDELLLELSPKGAQLYKSLDAEGKALALKVASQRCNGTNECKGLNACKTDKHDCAGLGECNSQSKCAFSDKNLAVKVVSKYMEQKRAKALGK